MLGTSLLFLNILDFSEMQMQRKVEKLKDTRDYSFLFSDDAEPPAPSKESQPRNISVPNSGGLLLFQVKSSFCYMEL